MQSWTLIRGKLLRLFDKRVNSPQTAFLLTQKHTMSSPQLQLATAMLSSCPIGGSQDQIPDFRRPFVSSGNIIFTRGSFLKSPPAFVSVSRFSKHHTDPRYEMDSSLVLEQKYNADLERHSSSLIELSILGWPIGGGQSFTMPKATMSGWKTGWKTNCQS